tara:strand:- start:10 stop:192 length:183 start_codon:yes stop_codon:yes gene_type:complete
MVVPFLKRRKYLSGKDFHKNLQFYIKNHYFEILNPKGGANLLTFTSLYRAVPYFVFKLAG